MGRKIEQIGETSSRRRFLTIASMGFATGLSGCLSLEESGTKENPTTTLTSGDTSTPRYTLEQLWTTEHDGKSLYSTSNSVVHVGEKTISEISKSSGNIKWHHEPKSNEFFLAQRRGSFVSNSTVVFVPALTSEAGAVYALERDTGSIRWRTGLPHRRSFITGIHDEFGLITVNQPRRGDMTEGTVVALDPSTGDVLWETEYPYKLYDAMLLDDLLLVADRESLKAVSIGASSSPDVVWGSLASTITPYDDNFVIADGISCRIVDGESMEVLSNITEIPDINPYPTTVSDDRIFVGTAGNDFIGIDINSKSVEWQVESDRKITAHAMGDKLVWMVNEGGRVLGLRPSDGSIQAEEDIIDMFEFEGATNAGVVGGWYIEDDQIFVAQGNSVRAFRIGER